MRGHKSRSGIADAPRSPLYVGGAVAVLSLGGLVLQLSSAGGSEKVSSVAADPRASDECTGGEFYTSVRDALAPGQDSAKSLARLSEEVGSGTVPDPAVAQSARQWETQLGTARDGVRELTSPARPWAEESHTMYELGAALYVESARAVPRVVDAAADPLARRDAMAAADRLRLLGDRVLDGGNRLLRQLSCEQDDAIEQRLPVEPVPDFRAEGLAADSDGTDVQAAVSLEDLARRLKDDVPEGPAAQEGAHALRLSLLVEAESKRSPEGDQSASAQRLQTIAAELRKTAAVLLDRDPSDPLTNLANGSV